MKLAEALVLRSDMKKKMESLRERIAKNAIVQEGEEPSEDPGTLMKEANGAIKQYRELVVKINATNVNQALPDGRSIMEAIAQRDELVQKHSLLTHAAAHSVRENDRYSQSEIKWRACLDVKKMRKQIDDLSKKIREVNLLIQETNWKTDLE